METRDLRWFQLVADGVTLTELARIERTSQPGISRALARLDAEVGAPLLYRSGRTLRMSQAGAAFKQHLDAALHQLDDGLAAVQQMVAPETGTVVLAFAPTLSTWLVPDLVRGFRDAHPGVGFDLRPMREEPAATVGTRSAVELELTTRRPRPGDVEWRALVREPLRLAVPKGHRLADRGEVELQEVAQEPFVTLGAASDLRELGEQLCSWAGFEPRIAFECEDVVTVRAFVRHGLGVAIVPAPRDGTTPRVHHLVIADRRAVREVGIAWAVERRLLPAARLFRDHVIERAAGGRLSSEGR